MYVGGLTLDSVPEVLRLSGGKSLPEDIREYDDAEDLMNIREGNFWGFLKSWRYNNLKEKYGLADTYNLD